MRKQSNPRLDIAAMDSYLAQVDATNDLAWELLNEMKDRCAAGKQHS